MHFASVQNTSDSGWDNLCSNSNDNSQNDPSQIALENQTASLYSVLLYALEFSDFVSSWTNFLLLYSSFPLNNLNLGCTETSFGILYTCRTCIIMVFYLLYHLIIFQKLLILPYCTCTRICTCVRISIYAP